MKNAATVEATDMVIESGTFPFEKYVNRFDAVANKADEQSRRTKPSVSESVCVCVCVSVCVCVVCGGKRRENNGMMWWSGVRWSGGVVFVVESRGE